MTDPTTSMLFLKIFRFASTDFRVETAEGNVVSVELWAMGCSEKFSQI